MLLLVLLALPHRRGKADCLVLRVVVFFFAIDGKKGCQLILRDGELWGGEKAGNRRQEPEEKVDGGIAAGYMYIQD